jgi:hypothetical protein
LIAALLLAVVLAQAPVAQVGSEADERALEVIERTKATRATYSLYSWMWVEDPDGSTRDGLSAEFHRGNRHRVETPNARVVADCEAQTGTGLDLATGERITGRHLAQIACGINTARPIVDISWLGSEPSRFGTVDRLRVVDEANERFYAVDRDGVLVGAEIYPLDGRGCLQSEPLAVDHSVPEGDLFSAESLDRSFVPQRFRRVPERIGDLLTPGRSCPGAGSDRQLGEDGEQSAADPRHVVAERGIEGGVSEAGTLDH